MGKGNTQKIGELLLEVNLITQQQLDEVLEQQKGTGKPVGEMLVENGYVSQKAMLEVLEFQMGIPHIDLSKTVVNPTVANLVSENIARRYGLIAVEKDGDQLKVAMSDPLNIIAVDDLKLTTNLKIVPLIAAEKDIRTAINNAYSTSKTENIVNQVETELKAQKLKEASGNSDMVEDVDNAPIVLLVKNMIDQAIAQEASDIHVEPFEDHVKIRYRIDGQLREVMRANKDTATPITTRIKILANLDIAERRIPQDGRIEIRNPGEELDLRVSILPTIYGEKTVIRLIYRTGMKLTVDQLGFHPNDLIKFKKLLQNPHGIILLTGPTGSGKSTTLASALREVNRPEVNIITVEDPVENMIEGINQVAVNVKAGLTFASALRSILRQDPDIIMIGEMRDSETSNIAIKAAITGHLVLSTLHTNDSTSSIARLVDMGSEPFMVGTAIKGIIAQRLARKICTHCRTEHIVTKEEEMIYRIKEGTKVYKGAGCRYCNNTGYKGRHALHEVFVVDSYMQDLISANKLTSEQLREQAIKRGMRTLWHNAHYNVLRGITTMEEMLKITYQQ